MTPSASGLYLENVWLWTADHDIEDPANTQISIYTGRGLLLDSTVGSALLYGTAVEHHALYQYQFAHTKNIFAGQIQTETPYYQPNPNAANSGFVINSMLNDPDFASSGGSSSTDSSSSSSSSISTATPIPLCSPATPMTRRTTSTITTTSVNSSALGLRILNSTGIRIYGAGLYSFFDNYSTNCSAAGHGENCQAEIFDIDNGGSGGVSDVEVYNLNTIGSTSMVKVDGESVAAFGDNVNVFPDCIALLKV